MTRHILRPLVIILIALAAGACGQRSAQQVTDSVATGSQTVKPDTTRADSTPAKELPDNKTVAAAQLIVPGKSIGQTGINESSEDVHKSLGKPDAGDAAMGKSISIWYANHDTSGYVTQMYFSRWQGDDDIKRVKQIRVTSPYFKLSSGINVGAAFENIRSAYQFSKVAVFTDKGGKRTLYDDNQKGLAVDVDDKGLITGITVHEPGRAAAVTYLPFFGDLKIVK